MKSNDKEKTINDFKSGLLKILVATTVIEVGIDNKNANTIIIENAEKFGLSQLHQLYFFLLNETCLLQDLIYSFL